MRERGAGFAIGGGGRGCACWSKSMVSKLVGVAETESGLGTVSRAPGNGLTTGAAGEGRKERRDTRIAVHSACPRGNSRVLMPKLLLFRRSASNRRSLEIFIRLHAGTKKRGIERRAEKTRVCVRAHARTHDGRMHRRVHFTRNCKRVPFYVADVRASLHVSI